MYCWANFLCSELKSCFASILNGSIPNSAAIAFNTPNNGPVGVTFFSVVALVCVDNNKSRIPLYDKPFKLTSAEFTASIIDFLVFSGKFKTSIAIFKSSILFFKSRFLVGVMSALSIWSIKVSVSACITSAKVPDSPICLSIETSSALPSFMYWFITSPLALYIIDFPAPPETPVNQPNKLSFLDTS